MVAGVEILFPAGGQRIEHKEFLGTERAAEGTLNNSALSPSGFVVCLVRIHRFVCHSPPPAIFFSARSLRRVRAETGFLDVDQAGTPPTFASARRTRVCVNGTL